MKNKERKSTRFRHGLLILTFTNASILASGLIFAAFSLLDSSVSISNNIKGKKQNMISISVKQCKSHTVGKRHK